MLKQSLSGLSRGQLKRWLTLFFLAVSLPLGMLVYHAYGQLKWEAFHQYRLQAEELSKRIDQQVRQLIDTEEARSYADYSFLTVAGDPSANFVQRSVLATFPVDSDVPGLLSYFQVDADGRFTTPLLPPAGTKFSDYGLSADDWNKRLGLQLKTQEILKANRLVPAERDVIAKSTDKASKANSAQQAKPKSRPSSQGISPGKAPGLGRDDAALRELETAASNLPATASEALAAPAAQTASAGAGAADQERLGQRGFDRLKSGDGEARRRSVTGRNELGSVADLKLDAPYRKQAAKEEKRAQADERLSKRSSPATVRSARKEQSALPLPITPAIPEPRGQIAATGSVRINTFESELDPFEFSQLDSGHFVLYRKVWRDGKRIIQGALIEQKSFLHGLIETPFQGTALAQMSNLVAAYRGDVLAAFSGQESRRYLRSAAELSGALLYQSRLSAPLSDIEMLFSVTALPAGTGAPVIYWTAGILGLLLPVGFYLMYKLGARQIDLTNQQQNFVSAVSHELRTPLTSIRMYAELLQQGWASDEKKKTYYGFISDESERLSRLIANVLQLANVTHNALKPNLKRLSLAELSDGMRSKVSSQVERAGFVANIDCAALLAQEAVFVDADFFSQIVINLVDNAIKFSAKAENKTIDIRWQRSGDKQLTLSVRDYGPGVPAGQMKKIFQLFYRTQDELTRETVGTGIGLALVNQLCRAMNATIAVNNANPGAEFRIQFDRLT